jgi:predicted nucleic acid-binding protein
MESVYPDTSAAIEAYKKYHVVQTSMELIEAPLSARGMRNRDNCFNVLVGGKYLIIISDLVFYEFRKVLKEKEKRIDDMYALKFFCDIGGHSRIYAKYKHGERGTKIDELGQRIIKVTKREIHPPDNIHVAIYLESPATYFLTGDKELEAALNQYRNDLSRITKKELKIIPSWF